MNGSVYLYHLYRVLEYIHVANKTVECFTVHATFCMCHKMSMFQFCSLCVYLLLQWFDFVSPTTEVVVGGDLLVVFTRILLCLFLLHQSSVFLLMWDPVCFLAGRIAIVHTVAFATFQWVVVCLWCVASSTATCMRRNCWQLVSSINGFDLIDVSTT